jgi:ABC-type transport system substrate-binding protein
MLRRRTGVVTLAILLGVPIFGSAPTHGSTPGASPNATVTVAEAVSPTTLDPQASPLVADFYAWELAYQCLLTTSSTGTITPQLATGYSVGGGRTIYDFTLRRNVQFHNGDRLTPADVVFTFQRLMKTGIPYAKSRFPTLKNVEATGPDSVRFILSEPDPSFILNMADASVVACAILNQHAGTTSNLALSMVGTGAYRMTSYVPHQELGFSRFDKYWGPAPKNGGLKVVYVPDPLTQRANLQSGKIDFFFPDTSLIRSLQGDRSVKLGESVTGTIDLLCLNSARKPFDDVRVRRAVALAIDRDAIAKVAFDGAAVPNSYLPPGLAWAPKLDAMPYSKRDINQARSLLSEAGYPNGLSAKLMYIAGYSPQSAREAALLQSQLGGSGLTITLDPQDQASWNTNFNIPAYDLNWNLYGSFADPYQYLRPRPGRQGPVPSSLQALIDQLRSTTTMAAYRDGVLAIAREEANLVYPDIPLVAWKTYVAYNPKLQDVKLPANLTRNFFADVWFR